MNETRRPWTGRIKHTEDSVWNDYADWKAWMVGKISADHEDIHTILDESDTAQAASLYSVMCELCEPAAEPIDSDLKAAQASMADPAPSITMEEFEHRHGLKHSPSEPAAEPAKFDRITRIQHVLAEDIGRILSSEGKARVEAILREPTTPEPAAELSDDERRRKSAASISDADLDKLTPAAEPASEPAGGERELPDSEGHWKREYGEWSGIVKQGQFCGWHNANDGSGWWSCTLDIADQLPRGNWHKAQDAGKGEEADNANENCVAQNSAPDDGGRLPTTASRYRVLP